MKYLLDIVFFISSCTTYSYIDYKPSTDKTLSEVTFLLVKHHDEPSAVFGLKPGLPNVSFTLKEKISDNEITEYKIGKLIGSKPWFGQTVFSFNTQFPTGDLIRLHYFRSFGGEDGIMIWGEIPMVFTKPKYEIRIHTYVERMTEGETFNDIDFAPQLVLKHTFGMEIYHIDKGQKYKVADIFPDSDTFVSKDVYEI